MLKVIVQVKMANFSYEYSSTNNSYTSLSLATSSSYESDVTSVSSFTDDDSSSVTSRLSQFSLANSLSGLSDTSYSQVDHSFCSRNVY